MTRAFLSRHQGKRPDPLRRGHGHPTPDQGFGVSLDFNPQTLEEYLADNPLAFPAYWAEENLAAQVGVQEIPLTLIHDRQGELAYKEEGIDSGDDLCEGIKGLIKP